MPKQSPKLRRTKAQKRVEARQPPPKPYIPLPETFAKLQSVAPYGRIGVQLPLFYDGVKAIRSVTKKALIMKSIMHNTRAMLTMIEKIIGPKVRGAGFTTGFYPPSSQNRIIWVNMGDLLTDLFPRFSQKTQERVLNKISHSVCRAFWMTRSFGYRLVMHYDLPINDGAIRFLMQLYWTARQVGMDYVSFTIPFSALTNPDYRLDYDTKVIKVVVDLPMTDKARSNYLTWCIKNKLDFIMQVPSSSKTWLKQEKDRLFRATRPLIILPVRKIKIRAADIDMAMMKVASLCRYTDVLLKQ